MISVEEFLRNHPIATERIGEGTGHRTPGPALPDSAVSDRVIGGDDAAEDVIDPIAPTDTVDMGDTAEPADDDGMDDSRDDDMDDDGSSEVRRASRRCRSRWGNGAGETDAPADSDACRETALRLLDAAARSSGTLRDRLLERGYDADVVERTIDRLVELRLIDDRDYAESVVRSCAGRMMGRRGAVMEMARKGVDRALAASVADEAERLGVFEDAAWELGRNVARRTRGLDMQTRRRRFWSAGGRKGHDPETLRRVAEELLS